MNYILVFGLFICCCLLSAMASYSVCLCRHISLHAKRIPTITTTATATITKISNFFNRVVMIVFHNIYFSQDAVCAFNGCDSFLLSLLLLLLSQWHCSILQFAPSLHFNLNERMEKLRQALYIFKECVIYIENTTHRMDTHER